MPSEPYHQVLSKRMERLVETCCDAWKHEVDVGQGGICGEECHQNGWAAARSKHITNLHSESQLCRDYAYMHLYLYRNGVSSKDTAEKHLRLNAFTQFPHLGKPDPNGVKNCYPSSLYACKKLLMVPDLNRYLIHMCPGGCHHYWTFMPDYEHHYRTCVGCNDCICPHCKIPRFVRDEDGVHGASSCWLFPDVFQQLMMDPAIAHSVLKGRASRNRFTAETESSSLDNPCMPSFAKTPEWLRLRSALVADDLNPEEVLALPLSLSDIPSLALGLCVS